MPVTFISVQLLKLWLAKAPEQAQQMANRELRAGTHQLWAERLGSDFGRHLLQAGEAVISTPEVRHAVLPESGGRIIVASDGLWDAINPKTAAHHVRGTPASKAAHDLVSLCALEILATQHQT